MDDEVAETSGRHTMLNKCTMSSDRDCSSTQHACGWLNQSVARVRRKQLAQTEILQDILLKLVRGEDIAVFHAGALA